MRCAMKKLDMEALLKANPKAAAHAEVIHKTISDLNQLREAGVQGGGFNLVPAFGGAARSGGTPRTGAKPRYLSPIKTDS